jgi:hypothetical protein
MKNTGSTKEILHQLTAEELGQISEEEIAQIEEAAEIAEQVMDTGAEIMQVVESESVLDKAFTRGIYLIDDHIIKKAVKPVWNKVPDVAKVAMTYMPPTSLEATSMVGNTLVRCGFLEVPGVPPEMAGMNSVKLLEIAGKYGQFIDPKMKICGLISKMATAINMAQDEIFFKRVRKIMDEKRQLEGLAAANDNAVYDDEYTFEAANDNGFEDYTSYDKAA